VDYKVATASLFFSSSQSSCILLSVLIPIKSPFATTPRSDSAIMHSTASAFNKVSRLGTRPPGFYSKSAAQSGARSSPHLPGLGEVAGQPAIPAVNETFDVAGHLANRSSIKINLKTTLANQGKGSPMGVIEIRSERLHVRCDEVCRTCSPKHCR
jgi:hypothetical protein